MQLPIELQPFFTWTYWFMASPPPFTGTAYYVVAGAVSGSFLLGLILRIVAGRFSDASTRVIVRRVSTCLMTVGIFAALAFGFTQTATPTLGSRFWFVLWLLVALVWMGYILRYAIRVAPKARASSARQAELNKYLPRSR